jgi:hypothetical protein
VSISCEKTGREDSEVVDDDMIFLRLGIWDLEL